MQHLELFVGGAKVTDGGSSKEIAIITRPELFGRVVGATLMNLIKTLSADVGGERNIWGVCGGPLNTRRSGCKLS